MGSTWPGYHPRVSSLAFVYFHCQAIPETRLGRMTLENNAKSEQFVGFPQQQQGLVSLGRASPAPYAARMTSRRKHTPQRAGFGPLGLSRLSFYVTACVSAELSKCSGNWWVFRCLPRCA